MAQQRRTEVVWMANIREKSSVCSKYLRIFPTTDPRHSVSSTFLSFFQGNNVCSIEHHHCESFLSSCLLSYHADYHLVLSSLISSDLIMLLVLMYAKLTDLRIRGTLQRQLISAQSLLIIVKSIQSIESLQEIDVNGKFSLIYILTIEPLILFQPSWIKPGTNIQ